MPEPLDVYDIRWSQETIKALSLFPQNQSLNAIFLGALALESNVPLQKLENAMYLTSAREEQLRAAMYRQHDKYHIPEISNEQMKLEDAWTNGVNVAMFTLAKITRLVDPKQDQQVPVWVFGDLNPLIAETYFFPLNPTTHETLRTIYGVGKEFFQSKETAKTLQEYRETFREGSPRGSIQRLLAAKTVVDLLATLRGGYRTALRSVVPDLADQITDNWPSLDFTE